MVLSFRSQQWCWLEEGRPLAWRFLLLEALSVFPFLCTVKFFFSLLCLFLHNPIRSLSVVPFHCPVLTCWTLCLVPGAGISWTFGSWTRTKGTSFLPRQRMPWAAATGRSWAVWHSSVSASPGPGERWARLAPLGFARLGSARFVLHVPTVVVATMTKGKPPLLKCESPPDWCSRSAQLCTWDLTPLL